MRLAPLVAGLAICVLVGPPPAGAAAADPDRLEVSLDGETWGRSPGVPLFEDGLVLAPGAGVRRSLKVRNLSGEPAQLVVTTSATSGHDALDDGAVVVRTRLDDGTWHGTGRAASVLVPAGARPRTVQVEVAVPARSGSGAMGRTVGLDLNLQLSADTDAAAVDLPDTGAGEYRLAVLAGGGLIGIGVALLRRRRVEPDTRPENKE